MLMFSCDCCLINMIFKHVELTETAGKILQSLRRNEETSTCFYGQMCIINSTQNIKSGREPTKDMDDIQEWWIKNNRARGEHKYGDQTENQKRRMGTNWEEVLG